MPILTFKGGVHPPEKKHFTKDKPFEKLPLPDFVYLFATNHLGAPAKPIVKEGDQVKTGQLVAEATGSISANIHSSVTGEVVGIESFINASTGRKDNAIVIKRTSEDVWEYIEHDENFKKFPKEEVINIVKKAGIVGLGGAMFPSHVKLSVPTNKKVEYLIINGAECEPYITVDDMMMREYTEEIIKGIKIIEYVVNPQKIYVGIEENKPEAIKIMENALKKENIKVAILKTKYPQGAEKQLIKAITKREVPSGGLPIDAGVLVFNVSTTYAIYDAVINGKPLVERGITLSGGVKKPGNYWFRIGTKVSDLLNHVELVEEEKIDRIIYGGPMMGLPLPNVDLPTFKGNNAITVLTKEEIPQKHEYPCIRCASCVKACPIGLQPYYLKKLADARKNDIAQENGIMDCIECGACSYICPSNIELVKTFKTTKKVIKAIQRRRV
ncbi:electron transport complex subunit RsxC [Petrotoga sp. SL27]|uniref:electron transport complex subunit RsxC n=1 Tax=Petrotoga sp. SL27 TaxID=1445612 RepID=UPI0007475018|nr:electron transport complex subunit RsxC [Petrotoga sp. SL27]KUK15981.1 MAG: Electron transport complex protein RnfC [Petrotoga mobilis]HBT51513.1 electron transport complex subunit RsxC [Petrotoga sp.]